MTQPNPPEIVCTSCGSRTSGRFCSNCGASLETQSCAQCGAIYHLENQPPAKPGVCDKCSGELIARPDDTEEAVRKRLESFHRQTAPVATYYKSKQLLREVDGIGPVDEVFERIERSLEPVKA